MAFVWAVLMGAAFGLLFDAFRIIRIAIPVADVIIAAQDILFFSICAVAAFFYLLGHADGRVRFFLLVGILLGAVIYFCTLSIPIMGVSRVIIAFVRGVLRFFWRYLILPILRLIYWIVSVVLYPVRLLLNIFKKCAQKLKIVLKRWRGLLYNSFTRLWPGCTANAQGEKNRRMRKGNRIWRRIKSKRRKS